MELIDFINHEYAPYLLIACELVVLIAIYIYGWWWVIKHALPEPDDHKNQD